MQVLLCMGLCILPGVIKTARSAMNVLTNMDEFIVTEKRHFYTVDATYGLWEIKISPSSDFGFFQHSLKPSHGGHLEIKRGAVIDWTNCEKLPAEVVLGLTKAGFTVK